MLYRQKLTKHFYPRSPCGERRQKDINRRPNHVISIHALLAESDGPQAIYPSSTPPISIHALLAESDNSSVTTADKEARISIHALLAESDSWPRGMIPLSLYFYPRSPCGERQLAARDDSIKFVFLSTLSLRRATLDRTPPLASRAFLSTLSLRRATSTHQQNPSKLANFYPRSPCGERQATENAGPASCAFLSTLSLRRATIEYFSALNNILFLSTLSLRRATGLIIIRVCYYTFFYPRSPCGERHLTDLRHWQVGQFSIHALLAESDS